MKATLTLPATPVQFLFALRCTPTYRHHIFTCSENEKLRWRSFHPTQPPAEIQPDHLAARGEMDLPITSLDLRLFEMKVRPETLPRPMALRTRRLGSSSSIKPNALTSRGTANGGGGFRLCCAVIWTWGLEKAERERAWRGEGVGTAACCAAATESRATLGIRPPSTASLPFSRCRGVFHTATL